MSTAKKDEAAPAPVDMTALLGRLDAHSDLLTQLRDAIERNTAATAALEERFGQLVVSGPTGSRDPASLTREQIGDALRLRPSASFRVLENISHGSMSWAKGSIVRPQVMEHSTWQALLQHRIKLEDADANP